MKIPMSWLREFVPLDEKLDVKTFMDKMTMLGQKTEGLERLGSELSGVVTGRVLSLTRHPNADKLLIVKLDVGQEAPLQIVTGATNLSVGDYVPAALDGAELAKGKHIAAGTLRGELSQGMLCSIEELGYTRDDYPEAPEDGIYVFKEPVPLGVDPAPILELREDVVEFELTSNRPDCFSVYGIAREASAAFNLPLQAPVPKPQEEADGDITAMIAVQIENPELCPRYCARVVKDVKIAPSPQWLRHRLTASGLRPINNIVDITNYVMLELGQPMHAFDIGCVRGGRIIVRTAQPGETITTLDNAPRKLEPSMLVIADAERPIAVAGVMGGEETMITGEAGAVLLESAAFNGVSIRQTSKKLGLRTDSSAKFEKGLDPNLPILAINRAAELIEQIGAGTVVRGVVDAYPNPRETWNVTYSAERINNLLGISITENEIEDFLAKLGIIAKNGVAHIPTFRPDLREEADIAEEVARLYGYDTITATLASGSAHVGKKSPEQLQLGVIRETMASLGFCEALSYAFESPKVFDKLALPGDSPLRRAAVIKNPLGEDFSVMRTTTASAMLASLSLNYNRRNDEAMLYEIAHSYLPHELPLVQLPEEPTCLTMGMYGDKDYFDMKGAAEYTMAKLGAPAAEFSPVTAEGHDCPFLHPGRKAYITINGEYIGYLGEVHPTVLDNYEIGTRAYLCVFRLDKLLPLCIGMPVYKPLPRFPGMRRDIAVIIDASVSVASVSAAIRGTAGTALEDVRLFDVYEGASLPSGKRSLAFSLHFRHPDRTLTDAETTEAVRAVTEELSGRFGAVLRDSK